MQLSYVPRGELARLRSLDAAAPDRAAAFADACRINTLYMVMRAGSGHLGTSFSCLDLLAWLYLEELAEGDRSFSSKGHDAPALYSVLIGLERLDFDLLHRLRRLDGLPGHPDVGSTPGIVTNTGSLGMGVSKARGFVLADRLAGRAAGRVFVLTGDGELQEGQFWESLQPTANRGLDQITVIVDHNKLQSDTWVADVSDLGDLEARVAAHGWAVARCDGHDLGAVATTLADLRAGAAGRPQLLVADTIKGHGVSFMEPDDVPHDGHGLYDFHSGAPSVEHYDAALAELRARLDVRLAALGAPVIELEGATGSRPAPPARPQRVVAAYGAELVDAAQREPRLVALDGDLRLDTGLVDFAQRFPDRFFECGIAEQDMVSMAGAMALAGLLPAVHSFACFLVPRAAEQVFNNASEHTKVLYAGSLVGIVPGGPGHSHQMIRDIALMGSVPGMACLEPFCEAEARAIVRWAVDEAPGSVYVRLVSVPWDLGFEPPAIDALAPGRGTVLREGDDATIVAAGPVLVASAMAAATDLAADGLQVGVIALPWLRDVDGAWLAETAGAGPIVALDNHVARGGQGDAVRAALGDDAGRVVGHAVESVPVCGTNDEVLAHHRLDAAGVASVVRAHVGAGSTA